MRHAIVALLLLCSCYRKSDAVSQLKDMGRPEPIVCVRINGGEDSAYAAFSCVDGARAHWICDKDDCIPGSR